MKCLNVNEKEIKKAIDVVNKQFEDNIYLKEYEYLNKSRSGTGFTVKFKLGVKDSSKAGSRRSIMMVNKDGSRRKLAIACYHVHGVFFDALLDINKNAEVRLSGNRKIYVEKTKVKADIKYGDIIGNWEDWEVGSYMQPSMMSEACECGYY